MLVSLLICFLKSNLSTSDEYDAAVFCGGLAQGLIKLDVFPDIIRVVKDSTCPSHSIAGSHAKEHQTNLLIKNIN